MRILNWHHQTQEGNSGEEQSQSKREPGMELEKQHKVPILKQGSQMEERSNSEAEIMSISNQSVRQTGVGSST